MMTNVAVVQPQELESTDMSFNSQTGKWQIIRSPVSNDSENALSDTQGAFLANIEFKRYRIVQDNVARKIRLYLHAKNESFDISTATLVDEVDMLSLDVAVDDVAISNGILTFTDTQTNTTLTFDTDSPIYSILTANTNAINLIGDGKSSALTIDLVVDPTTDNLLKITTSGALVDKNDILAVLNSAGIGAITFEHDVINQVLKINDQTIATSQLVNSAGEVIGHVISA